MTGLSEAEEQQQQELNFLTRHQLMAKGSRVSWWGWGNRHECLRICVWTRSQQLKDAATPQKGAEGGVQIGGDNVSNDSAIISQLPLDDGASIVSMNSILVAKRFSEKCECKSGKWKWKM